MLIREKTPLDRKNEVYRYSTKEELLDLFERAKHHEGLPLVFHHSIFESELFHFITTQSALHNVPVMFFKEFSLNLSQSICVLIRNKNERKIVNRLSNLLQDSAKFHLNNDGITYLRRIGIPVFLLHNEKNVVTEKNDFMDTPEYFHIDKNDVPMVSFFNKNQGVQILPQDFTKENDPFYEFISKYTKEISWEVKQNENPFDEEIKKLINWNDYSPIEVECLLDELEYISISNLGSLFFLASHIKDMSQVYFREDFTRFLLSHALGLSKRKPASQLSIEGPFDFSVKCHPNTKVSILLQFQSILKQYNMEIKHPFEMKKASADTYFRVLHTDLLFLYRDEENPQAMATSKVRKIKLLKSIYDCKSESERDNFFEDMRLYFTVYPDEEEYLKNSFSFNEGNTYLLRKLFNTSFIFEKDMYETIGETVKFDSTNANENGNAPLIYWDTNKKRLEVGA